MMSVEMIVCTVIRFNHGGRHFLQKKKKKWVALYINNNNNVTLFPEDNIFGTDASLTYSPQIQIHTCV